MEAGSTPLSISEDVLHEVRTFLQQFCKLVQCDRQPFLCSRFAQKCPEPDESGEGEPNGRRVKKDDLISAAKMKADESGKDIDRSRDAEAGYHAEIVAALCGHEHIVEDKQEKEDEGFKAVYTKVKGEDCV